MLLDFNTITDETLVATPEPPRDSAFLRFVAAQTIPEKTAHDKACRALGTVSRPSAFEYENKLGGEVEYFRP